MKKRTKKQGSERMREFGYVQCQLWLDAAEAEVIRKAAAAAGLKLATYIRQTVFAAAADQFKASTIARSQLS